MRAINLLPNDPAVEGRRGPPAPVIAGCVGAVVVTALLAVLYLSGSGTVAQQQRALASSQAAYNAIPAPAPPPAIDKELPQDRSARISALASVLGQRVVWDRLLREVSEVVPSDVWLVTLDAQAPTYAGAGATAAAATAGTLPTGFVVSGCTYSQDSVARFLSRLQLVPDLSDMTLGRSESQGGNSAGASVCPTGMVTFSLQGNVQLGGASS